LAIKENKNMKKVAIVSAANSRYMPLLRGLVRSVINAIDQSTEIQQSKPSGFFPVATQAYCCPKKLDYEISFYVLDCGLNEADKSWLSLFGVQIIQVEEPTLSHSRRFNPANTAFLERHALPTHAPGHDVYVWIDADAWVQSFNAGLLPYLMFAETHDVVIVPEIDRQIVYNAHHRQITKGWSIGNYTKYFSAEVAESLHQLPMLNNGVFSASADSKIWQLYESAMQFALYKNDGKPEFGIDQVSLAFAIYSGEVRFYALPLTCNWMVTHATPALMDDSECLVEPMWPFNEIGIVHLLDYTKWQRVGIQRIDGQGNSLSGDAMLLDYFSVTGNLDR
jgi:hypothetical protein